MRSALRDAEATPPAAGWERLEGELNAPVPRISAFRRYWPRIAAAAAAVLVFIGGGNFLLHEDRNRGNEGFVIATATDGGSTAAAHSTQPDAGAAAPEKAMEALVPSLEEVQAERLPGAATRASGGFALRQPGATYAANARAGRPAAGLQSQAADPGRPLLSDNTPVGRDASASAEEIAGVHSDPHGVSAQNDFTQADPAAGKPAGKATDELPAARAQSRTAQSDKAAAGKSPGNADARNTTGMQASRLGASFPEEKFVAYVAPHKKASFSLFAGGGVTGAGTSTGPGRMVMSNIATGDSFGSMAQLKYNYEDNSFRHHQPLSFGLSARKELRHGLSLESGVVYTLLWSDVRVKSSREDISQKLHFIGVPLRLNWQFYQTGGFSLYAGAGGMVEKCVAAKFGSRKVDEPGVQWSVTGTAGAQYMFGKLVGLYFEPEIAYYFTQTDLRTSRTDSSLSLALRLGVRFAF